MNAAAANPLRVLIVEDSRTQAEGLRFLLEGSGYQVSIVPNGGAALESVRANPPTLIISDIVMPQMDGYTLCRHVKNDPALRDIPVILMTSLSSPEDVINGLECGADNFIRKPCDETYLLSRIEYILSNRRTRADAKMGVEMEIVLRGKKHRIGSERQQIVDLLISTFEDAVHLNEQLRQKQEQLTALAAELEKKVEERTADLAAEVAERKQAEATYRALLEAAPDSIIGSAADGSIVLVNARTEELFGYRRDELISQPVEILFPMHLRDSYRHYRTAPSLPDADSPQLGTAFIGRRKDESEFPIDIALSPVETHVGLAVIAILRDLTERKKLESMVLQAQKMDAIGSLAGGIAHDFNNLLGLVVGYGELALTEAPEGSRLHDRIVQIGKAANRATALTRQLLAFSRRQVLEPRILSLNDVVTDLARMLGRLIGEHIELVTLLDPHVGLVEADPTQIEQVLMNLVVNARDAMPQGGRLTIATSNEELDTNHFKRHAVEFVPGSYVKIEVTDTGFGMDADTRQHIFEPFFTTKEIGKGTGLGLSTVFGIVKQSKGYVWVYSEPGKGTTFQVYLPRATATEKSQLVDSVSTTILTGIETVLLVEDSEPLRELGREFLETAGYTVLEAGDGISAIEVAEKYNGSIHALISDVILPGLIGSEVAKKLLVRRPSMKVLYVSGYPGEMLSHQGVLKTGIALLQKPYTQQALLQKLREVLDGRSKSEIVA